jgi:hypothetical protein
MYFIRNEDLNQSIYPYKKNLHHDFRVTKTGPYSLDRKHWQPVLERTCVGIFKQSMGDRNRVGIGLSYRPARLLSLAELFPWNRFLGSLKA